LQFSARIPASPDKVGESTNTALKNNFSQYSNSELSAPSQARQNLPFPANLHYTGKQPCADLSSNPLSLSLASF